MFEVFLTLSSAKTVYVHTTDLLVTFDVGIADSGAPAATIEQIGLVGVTDGLPTLLRERRWLQMLPSCGACPDRDLLRSEH